MREHGQNEEAEQLRAGELARLVAAVRTGADTDASLAERVDAIFAVESERVANAAVLAELLAPLLSERVHAPVTAAPAVFSPVPEEVPIVPEPVKPPVRAAASIADFIDEMIAQENTADRSGRGPRRRAS